MKSLFIFLLLFTGAANAYTTTKSGSNKATHRSDNDPRLQHTEYGRIHRNMTNANAGNFTNEVDHLWSGRCYDKANPNRPIAAALVFRYARNQHGFEVASVWNMNAHESHFDYSWPEDVRATYVYPNYEPRKNAYYLYLNANTITALRRDRHYLYEAVMNSRHQTSVLCEYFIRN